MYTCNTERMIDKIAAFSKFGDAGRGGITRFSLSPEDHLARNEFATGMEKIGAAIECDDMANIYATLPGSDPAAKRIAMASHSDSVQNGGNYDGILGVISAMEVLETIASEKIPHRHPLTAMIWTNEEGSLFPPAMMSSGVITGRFDKEKMLASKSRLDPGITFGAVLEASPWMGAATNRLSAEKYEAMFELHIEQGPILEEAGAEIGWSPAFWNGQLPDQNLGRPICRNDSMKNRRDALFAAAKCNIFESSGLDAASCYDRRSMPSCIHTVIDEMISPWTHGMKIPRLYKK